MTPTLLLISGWAHGPQAMQPMADALAANYAVQILTGAQVLNDYAIPSVDYIITGSMGGLLAMELLPESCKKLVLVSSSAKFCADEDYPCGTHEKILKRMINQLKRNPVPVLAEFYKNVHHPYRALRTAPCCSPNELVAGLEYLLTSDVRQKVPDIGIPVLLLHGTDDRIIPPSAAEWLHGHLPDSQLRIFENGGHALPSHHFTEVMDEISRFL
ncbi:MAG: alpha/beta fold hydrolase [Verrucomicrobia bacterium]|nr:alpha/beta fold hydrolase [Verrucomicrobiota bacterium]